MENVLDIYENPLASFNKKDETFKDYNTGSREFNRYIKNLRMTSILLKHPLFDPDALGKLLFCRIQIEKTFVDIIDLTDKTNSLLNPELWDGIDNVKSIINTNIPQAEKASIK